MSRVMPVAKRIIVKPVEEKHGTLIVNNMKPKKYTVISIGDEVTKVFPDDIIFIEKHYGIEIDHENQNYLVIDEESILAVVAHDDE